MLSWEGTQLLGVATITEKLTVRRAFIRCLVTRTRRDRVYAD